MFINEYVRHVNDGEVSDILAQWNIYWLKHHHINKSAKLNQVDTTIIEILNRTLTHHINQILFPLTESLTKEHTESTFILKMLCDEKYNVEALVIKYLINSIVT